MKVPEITKWKINYHIACGFILLMVILIYQDFIEMHSLENSAKYEIERQMRRERYVQWLNFNLSYVTSQIFLVIVIYKLFQDTNPKFNNPKLS